MRNAWKQALNKLTEQGASYADVRYYPQEDSSILVMFNGNLLHFQYQQEKGYGVRVLFNGAWGFAASSDLAKKDLTFRTALENARTAARRIKSPVLLADKEVLSGEFISPCALDPFEVETKEQIAMMQWLDRQINQEGVVNRQVVIQTNRKNIHYYDTEGAEIEKTITDIYPFISVMGTEDDGGMQERKYQPPRLYVTRGWKIMRRENWEKEADRIVRELNELRRAPLCPQDLRSVILLPDMMFLQVHETIGHPLELDRILGYELSFAGGSFVRLEDFGKLQYGSSKLTVRADATVTNSPGSFGFDDDGVACQNRLLIDKGVLVGAISSRQSAREANEAVGREIFSGSGGAARSTSFYRAPIDRMTNINVDPGEDGSLEDIVKNTERGLILGGEKSWSIGSNREQFHFATDIGWLVEDGVNKGVVRNTTYGGDTLEFYRSLSAVGDASTWELQYVNNCGKGAPSQIMQLGHGIPVCRFDNVKVGR
ncbi:MAG: TldD/PmbA family protein [Clostridiaceae bacterium]|nr:TldD/PmbA family protein [Clostridiaceae bacterium]